MTTTDKLAATLRLVLEYEDGRHGEPGVIGCQAVEEARAALAEYDADRAQVPNGDHAPGPWRIERKERHDGWMQTFIVGADFPDAGIVAEVNMGRSPLPAIERRPGDGEASARRIVACVNACAGIPIGILERGRVVKVHTDVDGDCPGTYERDLPPVGRPIIHDPRGPIPIPAPKAEGGAA